MQTQVQAFQMPITVALYGARKPVAVLADKFWEAFKTSITGAVHIKVLGKARRLALTPQVNLGKTVIRGQALPQPIAKFQL